LSANIGLAVSYVGAWPYNIKYFGGF